LTILDTSAHPISRRRQSPDLRGLRLGFLLGPKVPEYWTETEPRFEGIETYHQVTVVTSATPTETEPRFEGIETGNRQHRRCCRLGRRQSPDLRGLRLSLAFIMATLILGRRQSPDLRGLRLVQFRPFDYRQFGRRQSPDLRGLRLSPMIFPFLAGTWTETEPRFEGIETGIREKLYVLTVPDGDRAPI